MLLMRDPAPSPGARTFVLAIENSNPSSLAGGVAPSSIALGMATGDAPAAAPQCLAFEPVAAIDRSKADNDDLLAAIERCFVSAGASPQQIGLIAVSVGPGGYTALRSAVAAAKMIALVTRARCVSVPSAWCAAYACLPLDAPLAVVLASKGDSAFVTRFEPGFELAPVAPAGQLLTPASLEALKVQTLIMDEHAPPAFVQRAVELGLTVRPPRFDARALLAAARVLPQIDAQELLPLYAREPEAVTLWRQRKA